MRFPENTVKALIGLACGDAFGAPFEYHPKAPYYATLSMEQECYLDDSHVEGIKPSRVRVPGLYTDDTQQALAMLWVWRQLVLKGRDPTDAELFADVLMRVFHRMSTSRAGPFGVHRGTGRNFRTAIIQGKPVNTAGMGAAMRIGPVATLWPYGQPSELISWIHRVSEVTTTNLLAKDAAALFGSYVWQSCQGWSETSPYQVFGSYPKDLPDWSWDLLHRHLTFMGNTGGEETLLRHATESGQSDKTLTCAANGFCLTGMPWVFHHTQAADTYEDALVRVCSSGGDTDTVAAMAGCLAAVNDMPPPLWMTKGLVGYRSLISPHEWHPLATEEPFTLQERDLRRKWASNQGGPG